MCFSDRQADAEARLGRVEDDRELGEDAPPRQRRRAGGRERRLGSATLGRVRIRWPQRGQATSSPAIRSAKPSMQRQVGQRK